MEEQTELPLLIYDGDCTFCMYWARYWQKLTGDAVSYKPYQEVAEQYPSISIEEFQRAVQYVSSDKKISSGAEASFRTLSHAPYKAFWLWLYQWLPGFAFVSEKVYALIAAHRGFFYKISLILWGKNYSPPRFELVGGLFLRIFALIYLVAFVSFGMQALGLIGSKGIIPVAELTNAGRLQLGIERYWLLPMVFWLQSSDYFIQGVCWAGVVLSCFVFFNIFSRLSLFFLYVLYLSLFYAGQMFMSFQWDLFVLEAGVLTIILLQSRHVGIWLLRWLLFRFMLAGGLVKLLSGDPTWQNFTALNYYFFTQPLPTPVAWYVNLLPHSILAFCAAATLVIEIIFPFLIFLPRRIRFISAFAFLFFQTLILLTGNYNFFNILTMTLCLVLFDDAALQKIIPQKVVSVISLKKCFVSSKKIVPIFIGFFAIFTIFISLVQFQVRFRGSIPTPILWVYNKFDALHMVNLYGPFAVMTTDRMEIVLEGSEDGLEWKEYEFKYKPGDVMRRPLWNIPFQPRVDWQMWFAALSEPDQNFWFFRLLQRLLENSSDVTALLGKNPFPDKPPYLIRAQFYDYRFTTAEEKQQTGAWWKRRLVRYYLPEVRLN